MPESLWEVPGGETLHLVFLFVCFFVCFICAPTSSGILFPQPGIELMPPVMEAVLTTGQPGKS